MAKNITSIQEEKPITNFIDFMSRANDIGINVIEALIFAGAFEDFKINKKTLIQNIGNIQSYISFGSRGEFKYIDYPEFDFDFLQNKEKELLGVNFEYHPIHSYQKIIASNNYKVLSEALLSQSQNLEFVGVLSKVKIHKTKDGKDMAFIVLEDEFDSVDCVVFPDVYARFDFVLGKVYLVNGKLDYRNHRKSIIINRIKIIKE